MTVCNSTLSSFIPIYIVKDFTAGSIHATYNIPDLNNLFNTKNMLNTWGRSILPHLR